jgi:diguanylate cyclase (GGDEF)-like protein
MRDIRDFAMWCAFWAGWMVLVPTLMMSPQRIAVIWAGGGIAAGALILLDRARWWTVLVPLAAAVWTVWFVTGAPVDHALLRTVADVTAVVVYVVIIRRHRRVRSGLGADVGWVLVPSVLAAIVRLSAVAFLALLQDGTIEERLRDAVIETGMSTIVGLVAGSATVIGLAGWHRGMVAAKDRGRATAIGVGLGIVLFVAFFTGVGGAVPALEFIVFPLLLLSALLLPVPLTALFTGTTLIAISISVGKGLGVFVQGAPADSNEILTAQTYLLTIAASVFLLSASASDRRAALARAEAAAALMSASFRQSPTPAALVWMEGDQPAKIREANPAFEALVGASPGELADVPLMYVMVAADVDETLVIANGADVRVLLADGSVRWLRPSLSDRLVDADDEDQDVAAHLGEFAVLVLEDVTAERTSEELLRQQARRDALTGLPNRTALIERIDEALATLSEPSQVGLLLLDIDGLQTINDSLGHGVGDQVVVEMGKRLSDSVDAGEVVVRYGGDEFAILHPERAQEADVEALATWLRAVTESVVQVGDQQVTVTMTGGIASTAVESTRPTDLIRQADIALLRAKAAGRGQIAAYVAGDERPLMERMDMEGRLRRAIAEKSLVCLFQPTVSAGTGLVVGTEVLVRLRGDDGSLLPPGSFLPLAADLGLMGDITLQVLDQACAAAAAWLAAGHDIRVAFNVPPGWLSASSAEVIESTIESHGVPWSQMTVEVTEEATLLAGPAALQGLERLRARGIHVAIDDFGTGYAGLDSFRSLPADIVKIDMTFISDMLRTPEDRELVRSMIDLIHRFGKRSVAEGVETVEQFQALGEMGCDVIQGYLVGKPMPFEDFPAGGRLGQSRAAG